MSPWPTFTSTAARPCAPERVRDAFWSPARCGPTSKAPLTGCRDWPDHPAPRRGGVVRSDAGILRSDYGWSWQGGGPGRHLRSFLGHATILYATSASHCRRQQGMISRLSAGRWRWGGFGILRSALRLAVAGHGGVPIDDPGRDHGTGHAVAVAGAIRRRGGGGSRSGTTRRWGSAGGSAPRS